jgi:hypothetical protein
MLNRLLPLVIAALVAVTTVFAADARVTQLGRATVAYQSKDVRAVASYNYSQRQHAAAWLLVEFGIQATHRIVVHRDQLTLIGPDQRVVPIASQAQFADDQPTLKAFMQNASVWRQSFNSYFTSVPTHRTINFYTAPGGTISDSAVTNLEDVATGDLLFKSPDGTWAAGTYHLVLRHDKAMADLPIVLE